MPELPEVETIVRGLNQKIKGKIIKAVEVLAPKLVKPANTKFVQELQDQKIGKISRRAKLIIITLAEAKLLLVHLKMTGQLIYQKKSGQLIVGGHSTPRGLENLPNKFTRIIFTFSDDSRLYYNDLRKFGWLKIISRSALEKLLNNEFGIEPLSPSFTLNRFREILKSRANQPLKKVLLDQKNIAGLGNIYADESCFFAGVKPMRQVKSLAPVEVKKLWQGIRRVLNQAIKHRGTSVDTYVDAAGQPGGHVPYLKVYGRAGARCQRSGCRGVIQKIKFIGRGTHYCNQCQI